MTTIFKRRLLWLVVVSAILSFMLKTSANAECVPAPDPDLNNDGIVTIADLFLVTSKWGLNEGDVGFDPIADTNCDGMVNLTDVLFVQPHIGEEFPTEEFGPPQVSLSETCTSNPFVTATVTAHGADTVQILGGSSFIETDVINGAFSVDVPLNLNKVNHLFFTAIDANGIPSAPTAEQVIQDGEPPSLFIDFPEYGMELTTETTDVTGRVGDMLSGFLGLDVTVNGEPAEVIVGIGNNGTFVRLGVPLAIGPNTISATATDKKGNTISREITVERIEIPDDAHIMEVLSGNGQRGTVNEVLSDPVVVKVTRNNGSPFVNKLVNFMVTRSDGRLTPDGDGDGSLEFQVHTDANGFAQAFWKLGTDAGCGNNRIEATSEDIVGSTFFCASADPNNPKQINIGSGNNQRAEADGPAPEPLRVWVNDSCNGVEGVPVTFTTILGGGKVNGADSATVNTGITGHAEVNFTLGPDQGNNLIEADFPGNPGNPAVFVVFGIVRDETQPTNFSGIVLNNSSQPIGGATCSLVIGTDILPLIAETDYDGICTFDDITGSGPAKLFVDGLTARAVNGQPIPPGSFPALSFETIIVPNAANSLPTPVLLPALNPNNARTYDGTQDVELTVEGIDGLKMLVKAGSMTRADGTVPSPSNPATLALNQVHFDDVPMPMPDGAAPPFAWTLQPAGATFDPPVEVTYPNMSGLPAGAIAYFLSFNHDTNRFEIVATGRVTDDGSEIIGDPGAGIMVAGWGCNCPPYSVAGDCENCNVSITTGPNTACVNDVVAFSASGSPEGGVFSWVGGGTPSSGSGASFTTKFSSQGAKTVSVSYTCQTSNGPITGSDSVQVEVSKDGEPLELINKEFEAPSALVDKIKLALQIFGGDANFGGKVALVGDATSRCCPDNSGFPFDASVAVSVNVTAGLTASSTPVPVPIPGIPPIFTVKAKIAGNVIANAGPATVMYDGCLNQFTGQATGDVTATLTMSGVFSDLWQIIMLELGATTGLTGDVNIKPVSNKIVASGTVGHLGLVVFVKGTFNPPIGDPQEIEGNFSVFDPETIGLWQHTIINSPSELL